MKLFLLHPIRKEFATLGIDSLRRGNSYQIVFASLINRGLL